MGIVDEIEGDYKSAYRHIWSKAGYKPHKHQEDFHKCNKRYRALIAGVSGGKTIAGAAEAVRYALEHPGATIMVAAANLPQLRRSALPELRRFLVPEILQYENKSEGEFKLKNGSLIWITSLEDPDRTARGPTVAAIWAEEGAYLTEYEFRLLLGRLRQIGFPQQFWTTTTPKGMNWVYKYFVERPTKEPKFRDDYWYVRFSTKANPYLDVKFIEGLEQNYDSRLLKQDMEAEFIGFEGQVYTFLDDEHVKNLKGQYDVKELQFKEILYGVDWGYKNPSVILAVGVDSDDRLYVMEELYQSGLVIDDFVKLAVEFRDHWGEGKFVCDPSQPGSIELLAQHGLWATGGYNSIPEGIQMVSSRLIRQKDNRYRMYVDERCSNLIAEFHKYRYPEIKEGAVTRELPLAIDNHALDALRYVTMEIDRMRGNWGILENEDLDAIMDFAPRPGSYKFK